MAASYARARVVLQLLDGIQVDLGGRRPMFRIRAELEKGNEDRLLPMIGEVL